MKKLFVFVVFIIVLFSCGSKVSNLENAVKRYYVPKLKDPKSFEQISLLVRDTLYVDNKLDAVRFWVEYRAKNSFGGYIIKTEHFIYFPKKDYLSF